MAQTYNGEKMNIPQAIDKRIENIMIGGTRFGSWNEVMNAPGNEWCHIVMKFNMIVLPTMVFLEWGWY